MRIIYIDPDARTVEAREIKPSEELFQKLVGGYFAPHWIVPAVLPRHTCYVDEAGLVKKKTLWWFHRVHIWGPMVIFRQGKGNEASATLPLQDVTDLVLFDPKG